MVALDSGQCGTSPSNDWMFMDGITLACGEADMVWQEEAVIRESCQAQSTDLGLMTFYT